MGVTCVYVGVGVNAPSHSTEVDGGNYGVVFEDRASAVSKATKVSMFVTDMVRSEVDSSRMTPFLSSIDALVE